MAIARRASVSRKAATVAAPRKADRKAAAPIPAKAVKNGKAEPAREYAPIPEDALIIPTGEKTAFIATYTSFVDDNGKQHDSIVFTKGYKRADGALTMTGKSGTLPQAMFKGKKGAAQAKAIYDWLLSFNG
jgi:hypothetical protein